MLRKHLLQWKAYIFILIILGELKGTYYPLGGLSEANRK